MPKHQPSDDEPTAEPDNEFVDEYGRPNKSALKRRAQGLQDLGEVLIDLPQTDWPSLAGIIRALSCWRGVSTHMGALSTETLREIARKIDAEPIRLAIEARQARDRAATRQFQLIERWRSRLIEEPAALDEFLQSHTADRALIERLIAQARFERDRQKPPKAARELFSVVDMSIKGTAP